MPKKLRKTDNCLNCERKIGSYDYCPYCGQQNTTKQMPLRYFLHDFLGDYLTFDSRFFRSFIPLLRKPGYLTEQYNSGRRTDYILPLRLYLFTTIFFFFLISLHRQIGQDAESLASRVVTRDSLQAVIDQYDESVPEDIRHLMVSDLNKKFRLTTKKIEKPAYYDSVYQALGTITSPVLSPGHKTLLTETIFEYFKVDRRRRRGNDITAIDSLESLVQAQSGLANRSREIAGLFDERFRVRLRRTRKIQSDGGIELSFGESDSTDVTWQKTLAKKAEKLASMGEDGTTLFVREMLNQLPKVMFLVLPIFALILKLLYIRQKIYYINHLIFSLHAHTVIFIYLLIAIFWDNGYVIAGVVIAIWLHIFISMRHVYRQTKLMTFLKLQALLGLYTVPVLFGFVLLAALAVFNV